LNRWNDTHMGQNIMPPPIVHVPRGGHWVHRRGRRGSRRRVRDCRRPPEVSRLMTEILSICPVALVFISMELKGSDRRHPTTVNALNLSCNSAWEMHKNSAAPIARILGTSGRLQCPSTRRISDTKVEGFWVTLLNRCIAHFLSPFKSFHLDPIVSFHLLSAAPHLDTHL
jgi:hypothetical protein